MNPENLQIISKLDDTNLIDSVRIFEIYGVLNFEIFSKFGYTHHRPTLDTGQFEKQTAQNHCPIGSLPRSFKRKAKKAAHLSLGVLAETNKRYLQTLVTALKHYFLKIYNESRVHQTMIKVIRTKVVPEFVNFIGTRKMVNVVSSEGKAMVLMIEEMCEILRSFGALPQSMIRNPKPAAPRGLPGPGSAAGPVAPQPVPLDLSEEAGFADLKTILDYTETPRLFYNARTHYIHLDRGLTHRFQTFAHVLLQNEIVQNAMQDDETNIIEHIASISALTDHQDPWYMEQKNKNLGFVEIRRNTLEPKKVLEVLINYLLTEMRSYAGSKNWDTCERILKILIGWLERHRPDDLEGAEATNEAAFAGGGGEDSEEEQGK
jgi:hypothetical protein